MVSRRRATTAVAVAVCCLGFIIGPGVGSAHAIQPVAEDLVDGDAPGPIPPLPLPGNPPVPDNDPFYRQPPDLDRHQPGAILRSRRIIALGLTAVSSIERYQLLFRSTDALKRPIAAVTTVLVPNIPGPGSRKLVSYQPFEDSLTTGCAPSYTLRTNSGFIQPVENGFIAAALANGWDVVVPDHEGPRSELIVGPLAGRITLDSIRAAERFAPAALDGPRTLVGLMGYSGGSIPTAWGNALADAYAPELKIVGTSTGGAIADVGDFMRAHGQPLFFSAAVVAGIGLDRAYPGVNFRTLLNARGRALAERLGKDSNGCLGALSAAPLDSVTSDTRYPDMNSLLAVPGLARALRKTNLILGPRLGSPTLLVHGVQDELVPVGQIDQFVAANCGHGVPIDYQRIPGEHGSTFAAWEALSLTYLRGRFGGRPATSTCSARPSGLLRPPAPS